MSQDNEGATFYAGAAEIALHRTETGNYRDNLAFGERPALGCLARDRRRAADLEVFAVTCDPAEGEALTEAGNDVVDVVAMPEAVQALVSDFVREHHVERPFYKRKRDRADPQALARQGPMRREPR